MSKKSDQMKGHWDQLRKLRAVLGVGLQELNLEWRKLRDSGLIQKVLAGDEVAIRDAKELFSKGQFVENIPGVNNLKIMLWAINKIGNLEQARDAFERATEACRLKK